MMAAVAVRTDWSYYYYWQEMVPEKQSAFREVDHSANMCVADAYFIAVMPEDFNETVVE